MNIEVTEQELELIIDALGTQFLEYSSRDAERLADRLRSERNTVLDSEPHLCGHFHRRDMFTPCPQAPCGDYRCCINY